MDHNLKLTVSETIDASASAVWKALTDKEMIKQYFYGTEVESDWKEGSPMTFRGTWKGQKYEDKGTVLEVKEEKRLKTSYWSSMSGMEDKPENYATVTYELERKSGHGHTALTITQKGFRDREAYEHSVDGWKQVLINLKVLLEK